MKSRSVIFMVTAVLLVGAVYNSSYTFQVFVEGAISGGVSCSPQGNGKTYCCASVTDEPYYGTSTTYCTTCDNTNPPSNCTEREKPLVVNPGRDLSNVLENSLLEEPTTLPNINQSVGPRWGEVLQTENNLTFSQANISSDDSSNNTLTMKKSDLVVSDTLENSTKTVADAGEQIEDESATTQEEDNDEEDENKNEDEDKNDEESTTSQ